MDPVLELLEPMTPVLSTTDFAALLGEYHLLEPTQLKEAVEVLQGKFTESKAFADELVHRGWLTEYQSDQILKGKAKELAIGPYRILQLLGEGGMGHVFKALHRRLYRMVALKVIRQDRLSRDSEVVRRFQREAQAAAQLSHPNVVLIYDADEVDNKHFITMEYVEGVDLARLVKDKGALSVARSCEYVRQAALGLQHAHERGLIHRDIKPSNLLVTRQAAKPYLMQVGQAAEAGSDSASRFLAAHDSGAEGYGVVKILDMGLARLHTPTATGDSFQTEAGVVMGTPDFIAPEQARNPRGVDHRADIYSLGCTLYFLLTGRAPFTEGGSIEKMLAHQMDDPTPIEQIRQDVPPHIHAIIRKMMAKRPSDRFESAQHVADALTSLNAPETVPSIALPPNVGNTASEDDDAGTTAVVRVTPNVGPTKPMTPPPAPPAAPPPAPPAPAPAPVDKEVYVETKAVVPVKKPEAPAGAKPDAKIAAPASAPPEAPKPAEPAAKAALDTAESTPGLPTVRPKFPAPKTSRPGAMPPATAKPPAPATQQIFLFRGHRSWVLSMCFSVDRNLLASGGVDGTVRVWSFSSTYPKEQVGHQPHNSEVHAVAFSRDSKYLASASGTLHGIVQLWAVTPTGMAPTKVLVGHFAPVEALAFFPDSKTLASTGADFTVRLWDVATGQERTTLKGHEGTVQALAVSPDGRLVASGGQDTTARLWSQGTLWGWSEHAVLAGHGGAVTALAFSPDGKTLVTGGADAAILLWDLHSGNPLRVKAVLDGNESTVRHLLFLPDGRHMVSLSDRGRVLLWDIQAGKCARDWPAAGMMASSHALTFDGRYLALGKNDGSIAILRLYPKSKAKE
jgi:serine/threonine protein kinase